MEIILSKLPDIVNTRAIDATKCAGHPRYGTKGCIKDAGNSVNYTLTAVSVGIKI